MDGLLCTCPLGTPKYTSLEGDVEISACTCCGAVEVEPWVDQEAYEAYLEAQIEKESQLELAL